MLERYYIRPVTVDRVRTSWIAPAIEQYVGWLAEQRYSTKTVSRRIPLLVAFGEFAKEHGATEVAQLAAHVEPFVQMWISQHARRKRVARVRKQIGEFARNAVSQMLRLVIPGYLGPARPHRPANPFEAQVPGFISHLTEEKGLRPRSLDHYRSHLGQFAAYLTRIGLKDLAHLSPKVLSGFVADYGPRVAWTTLRNACGTLRVFVRYLHRDGGVGQGLEFPRGVSAVVPSVRDPALDRMGASRAGALRDR